MKLRQPQIKTERKKDQTSERQFRGFLLLNAHR